MDRSESITSLAKALAAAMGAVDNAAKDTENPHFKRKYADLASVRDAIRGPFAANGLSYPQFLSTRQGMTVGDDIETIVGVETLLLHESGEWMSSKFELSVWNADPQKLGSAQTYGRRYSLMAVTGVAPEDDDGNAATQRSPSMGNAPRQAPQQAPRPQPQQTAPQQQRPASQPPASAQPAQAAEPPVTAEQTAQIKAIMSELGVSNMLGANTMAKELTGLTMQQTVTAAQARTLIAKLMQKRIDAQQGAQ